MFSKEEYLLSMGFILLRTLHSVLLNKFVKRKTDIYPVTKEIHAVKQGRFSFSFQNSPNLYSVFQVCCLSILRLSMEFNTQVSQFFQDRFHGHQCLVLMGSPNGDQNCLANLTGQNSDILHLQVFVLIYISFSEVLLHQYGNYNLFF